MFTAWTLRESLLRRKKFSIAESRSRLRFTGLPEGDKRDPEAYKTAIARLPKGSAVISKSSLLTHSLHFLIPILACSLHPRLDSLPYRKARLGIRPPRYGHKARYAIA